MDDHSPQRLHRLLMELVRLAGLLQVETAPPGHSVSLSQSFTLHELDRPTPTSQQELAERLRLEKSTVSRLAADLERKGLLVRERVPDNRRLYRLRLTDEGRAFHARMAAGFDELYERWMSMMTEAEHDALITGLGALVRAMREQPVDHRHHPGNPAGRDRV